MKKYGLMIAAMLLCAVTEAGTLDSLITRLDRFGRAIPQEKVYVHMDNTCYWLGDTVWFAAYTRQTNNGLPSGISRILYAELYNQDGFLMERQLIEMKDGRGHGNFVLRPSYYYGGYYELRAYTRWQLNWGKFEHKHSRVAGQWFINKEKEAQFYRDYDKLYSRVFPVYDQPKQSGTFDRDMTSRPMRRYFRKDQNKRALQVSFYPEGGQLVSGLPCRMAFEACYSDGEWVDGTLHLGADSAVTVHRGRGTIAITPSDDMPRQAVFITPDGQEVTSKLPQAAPTGIAMQLLWKGDSCTVVIDATADMPVTDMGISIMHEGVLRKYSRLTGRHIRLPIPTDALPEGVNQLSVFDSDGRVWADRLFFVRKVQKSSASVVIGGIKDVYDPFEHIELSVESQHPNAAISLSIRDRYSQEYLYDSGNIMTEMLLASEIKGFVPQPEWYFEADDNLHRQGLDLLMMTQGWRRFNWQDMAVSGRWEIEQPAEKYQILTGRVTKPIDGEKGLEGVVSSIGGELEDFDIADEDREQANEVPSHLQRSNRLGDGTLKREVKLHAELVKTDPVATAVVEGASSERGHFRLVIPRFEGKCIFFLSASDTTKWRRGYNYEWVQLARNDDEHFEKLRYDWKFRDKDAQPLRISLDFPYPRFVKPYSFYQQNLASEPEDKYMEHLSDISLMKEVKVRAKRNGQRKFSDANPVLALDAYDGFNLAYDAGFIDYGPWGTVRALIGDMGRKFPFEYKATSGIKAMKKELEENAEAGGAGAPKLVLDDGIRVRFGILPLQRTSQGVEPGEDSTYVRQNLRSQSENYQFSFGEARQYNSLAKLDKYVLYTDYMPRLEGADRYEGSNLPETDIVIYPPPDGNLRATYRDRRLILPGISVPDQFYHPDYSKRPLPDVKDYRRTLYWNPDLKLDDKGRATIQFYNNCQQTRLSVSADGMTENGQLLTGTNINYE